MKYLQFLWVLVLFVYHNQSLAQDLHSHSNAAHSSSEGNNASGWFGNAQISSVTEDPFHGTFCLKAEITASSGRDVRYSFPAIIGEEYNIVLWAKLGQGTKPAFANWQGFQGFSTSLISSSQWTQYSFTLTATSSNPELRVYMGSAKNANPGDHVFIDRISINSTSISDNESPSGIDDLDVSNVAETSLQLNWSEPDDNVGVVTYEVFKDNISIGTTNSTGFNVSTDLSPSTSYTFHVIAFDAAGNQSPPSNNVVVQTLADTTIPNSVTSISSSNLTFNGLTLNWLIPSDNIGVVDYEVFQNSLSIGLTDNANSLNIVNLSPNTNYIFDVIAIDAAGNRSLPGTELNVTTPAAPDNEPPGSVGGLSASNTGLTSVTLNWNIPTDNIGVSGYEVYKDNVLLTTSNTNSIEINGLLPGSTYDFEIVALDAVGNRSTNNSVLEVITLSDDEAPSEITDLNGSNISMTTVDLSWSASTDNVSVVGYDIYRNNILINSDHQSSFFTANGLVSDTDYSFHVIAKDGSGNSTQSNSIDIKTLSAISYNSTNANLTTVDWQARDLFADRSIGVGTNDTQGYMLAVAGNMVAEEIKVSLTVDWPDYVFSDEYNLKSLSEVAAYLEANGHLENIPDSETVKKEGISLGEMNAKLLEKIEELTLYIIEQEKRISALEEKLKP